MLLLSGRRRVSMAIGCLALVSAPLRPGMAGAATGVSVDPLETWGTAGAGNGRAQRVLAIVEAEGRVYLGGEFTKMVDPRRGVEQTRNHLATLDVSSGNLLSWNPRVDGTVRDMVLSPDGTRLYLGGDFNRIGGQSARKLAAINLATGKIDARFRPAVKGRVRSLALHGNRLYVGGDFGAVGNTTRPKLAAVDATTGDLLDWAPPPIAPGRYTGQTGVATPDARSGDVYSLAVPADGSVVYAAGNFIDFAGQGGLVAFDAVTAQPLTRQWTVERPVFDIGIWPGDGRTLFAATGGPGGRLYAFRPDRTKPLWRVSVDGDAAGVAASTTTVFLAGHYDFVVDKKSSCYQRCPKGPGRRHLAAFDAATGVLDPWNPVADTSTGPFVAAVGAQHVYVAGEFNRINGKPHPGFAQFPRGT